MSNKNKGNKKDNTSNKNAVVRNINSNNKSSNNNKDMAYIRTLPTSEYLKATVEKDVQKGLLRVSRLRPENPIEYLGKYLLEKSKK